MADDLDLGATLRGYRSGQKVFGRYTLQKILGRGGMGVVWLARDEQLDRDVALKFLPEILAMDKEAVRDLKRETRRSLELTHSHIVRIYDFVQDASAAAISMEYIAGDTLAARKAEDPRGHFEVRELREWVRQLGEALTYAHEKAEVVHRDLKPANLMIDARGDLRVADFGIAASVSDSVSRVSVQAGSSGTPVYMSPQQMMGEKPAVSDDVYAVGATLFDLLTGKPPFYRGNVVMQVQGKPAPTIAERRTELGVTGEPIPPHWEKTIAACLAKEAGERPVSVAELTRRLSDEARPVPVRGEDLSMKLDFTAEDLRLGGTFEFIHRPGMLGIKLRLQVPAGTRPGQILRLRGEGRPGSDGGEPGDLLITVEEQAATEPPPGQNAEGSSPLLTVRDVFWSGLALAGSLLLFAFILNDLYHTWINGVYDAYNGRYEHESWRWVGYCWWIIWLGLSVTLVHRATLKAWPSRQRLIRAGGWAVIGLAWLEGTVWFSEYTRPITFLMPLFVILIGVAGLMVVGNLLWLRRATSPGSSAHGIMLQWREIKEVMIWSLPLCLLVVFAPVTTYWEGMSESVNSWLVAGGTVWLTLCRFVRKEATPGGAGGTDWRWYWLGWATAMTGLLSLGMVWGWTLIESLGFFARDKLSLYGEAVLLLCWLALLLGLASRGSAEVTTRRAWWIWGLVAMVVWMALRLYLPHLDLSGLAAPERFLPVVGPTFALGMLLAWTAWGLFARAKGGRVRMIHLLGVGALAGLLGAAAGLVPGGLSLGVEQRLPLILVPVVVILTVMSAVVYVLPGVKPSGGK